MNFNFCYTFLRTSQELGLYNPSLYPQHLEWYLASREMEWEVFVEWLDRYMISFSVTLKIFFEEKKLKKKEVQQLNKHLD